MHFLYDNVVTIAVASIACTFAWLYGGAVADSLIPVMPWLFVFLLDVMLCFPQRRNGEKIEEARERVWVAMKKDKLTWVICSFVLLLLIPFINKGLCPICDYPAIQYENQNPSPLIPFLPFCVNRLNHLNVVMWFAPSLLAVIAVRHSLLRRGKRMLLEMIVWNGVLLSAIGVVQQIFGATSPLWKDFGETLNIYFFSTFGYPNMGGDYFTTLFALAVALWRWKFNEYQSDRKDHHARKKIGDQLFWMRHLMLIPAVIFFFSALTTLSRFAIITASVLAIIFFLHTFISFFARISKVKRVKAMAVTAACLIGIVLCTMSFLPKDLQNEVDSLDSYEVLARATGKGAYHPRVAIEVWKDNFLFGCGGWGYKHFCIPKMTDSEMRHLQTVGGANVHNDYLQFFTEHGLIGFGLVIIIVGMIISPICKIWNKLIKANRFLPQKDQTAKPFTIFVLPASVFFILLAAVGTLVHAFLDCPLRSGAILSLFFISLSACQGFLPHIEKD